MQRTSSAKPKRERGNIVRLPPGFFVLLLMCTTSMTALVRAQQCASYDPTIAAGTLAELCTLYRLPSSLYEYQALNITQAGSATLSAQQLQVAPLVPYVCTRVYMPWVCATAYPLCSMEPSLVDPSLLLPVALPTCYETCDRAESVCRPYLEELGFGELLPSCDATNAATGLPIWPQNESLFPIPPPLGPLPIQCSVPSDTPDQFLFPCPEDLQFNPDDEDQPTCEIPCLPSYANLEHRLAIYLSMVITAWISFAFLVVGILVFFLIPAYREWPRRMFFYLAFSILFLNVAFMMMTFRDYKTLNCHNDFYCGLQTFLTSTVAVSASWWWALTILTTFVTVVWNTVKMNLHGQSRRNRVVLEVICHILGWGSGLISLIIYLAGGAYTVSSHGVSAAATLICPPGNTTIWFPWISIYLWVLLALVIVLILAPIIVIYMSRVSSNSVRETATRLIIYSCYYVAILVMMVVNQGVKTSNYDRYPAQVEEWYLCTLRGEPECPKVQMLSPVALECVAWILLNSAGTAFVLLIPLTPRNLRYIGAMIRNVRGGRPVYEGLGSGPAGTTTTTTTSNFTGRGGVGTRDVTGTASGTGPANTSFSSDSL